mmetsp:Transcript_53177/g.59476  ORF Transcript_53177/g.59476 Transcript_53177/m.59476 type:complete len:104 (-) Transcript_53177:109-420(-)
MSSSTSSSPSPSSPVATTRSYPHRSSDSDMNLIRQSFPSIISNDVDVDVDVDIDVGDDKLSVSFFFEEEVYEKFIKTCDGPPGSLAASITGVSSISPTDDVND